MNTDSPCADCLKHTPTCHADCLDYARWRNKRKKEKDAMNRAKQKSNIVSEYSAKSARRVTKRSNKKRKQ